MRRQYTFIAPKGKESKVQMGRHLFNMHCDIQRILHEAGEIILQHQKLRRQTVRTGKGGKETHQPFSGTGAYYVKRVSARTSLLESKDPRLVSRIIPQSIGGSIDTRHQSIIMQIRIQSKKCSTVSNPPDPYEYRSRTEYDPFVRYRQLDIPRRRRDRLLNCIAQHTQASARSILNCIIGTLCHAHR